MPLSTEWIEPELFLEHNGVKIFHAYDDDQFERGRLAFHFAVEAEEEPDGLDFDVRDLPTFKAVPMDRFPGVAPDGIRAAIIKAIDQGLLAEGKTYPE